MSATGASVEGVLRQAASLLAAGGIEQPRHEARILLGHVMGLSRERLLVAHRNPVDAPLVDQLMGLARRRAAHEPIAYLTGEREFWGLSFEVTRDTLIPRPDSETLIEAVLEAANRERRENARIVDFGVGGGCLLVSLLKELPGVEGFGVDRSVGALKVARRNARRHGVSSRAHFLAGSWGRSLAPAFDLIIANPPYVAAADGTSLMPEVAEYEPAGALFAGARGDEAYRALAPDFARLLAPGGRVFVELGAGMGDRVAAILGGSGLAESGRRKDLAGIERCAIFDLSGA
ncbi:MAG: peptide chain release factor N(5)-glutamine methyltransferase [Alphaproteobacteria bacterium]|jgi:release factor glutamine methyltransferase|nr:peptide chain release factor N(5)-glutamine methyltransferase [Alphaproteobacteria bacterium]MDP6818693.1 peptide chain release factor N(5)-glutamine methyltransferase [Alphaproteobacteria bacterium]|tara:strand:+ start:1271 stop:2140 length:870 start_codon:yes stop_codon:yes gene_type:complete